MGPRRLGFVFAAAFLLALLLQLQAFAAEEYFVSPDGSDSASGTESDPWGSFSHALSQLEPGDVLTARGGTYEEEVRNPNLSSGSENSPITVRAADGERPVVEGLFWLTDPDYWRIDGINVTWGNGDAGEHMVKMTGGTGWEWVNSEIWGAQSYAGMLVYSPDGSEPRNWRVAGNCIHDTGTANGPNRDHLIYANSGEGAGVIEGNVMFNAPNGEAVKLGGSATNEGGASNVTVRYNTMVDAAQTVLVAWDSGDNTIERNIMVGAAGNYSNVRAYQVHRSGNVVTDNIGYDSESMISNYDGGVGLEDAGGNIHGVNPGFDSIGCNGFSPTNPEAEGYGHTAYDGPEAPGGSGSGSGDGEGSGQSEDSREGRFGDDDDSVFQRDIERLARAGITAGCNPPDNDRFCPDRSVTRAEMATFLAKAQDLSGGSDKFGDIGRNVHAKNIRAIASAGITTGCNPPDNDRFCPDRSVTRAEMATFLAKAQDLSGGSDKFGDIGRNVHAKNIRAIASAGVTKGCNPPDNTRYCPSRKVTRGEMAAFLVRAFDL